VRELQQVIENLVALVPGDVIDADDVLRELEAAPLARGDRTELAALLLRHGMNTARAARAVGLSRSTLQRWLAEVELVGNRHPGRPRDHQDDGSENCPWAI
jgi:transcriptional regulator of acetoin/glycerol metabolism